MVVHFCVVILVVRVRVFVALVRCFCQRGWVTVLVLIITLILRVLIVIRWIGCVGFYGFVYVSFFFIV